MPLVDLSGAVLQRSIQPQSGAAIANYITVEENSTDDVVGTEHPIDAGAIMSDHIYLRPPRVKLRLGWSNADPTAAGPSYVRDVYATLQALKNSRQLFTAYTGKRLYNNMFVEHLGVPTTAATEWSMIAEIELKQYLLVNSQVPSGQPSSTTAGINSGGANPPAATPTTQLGNQQLRQDSTNFDVPAVTPPAPVPAVTNSNDGGAGPPVFFGM
jgi:hypothetical protein